MAEKLEIHIDGGKCKVIEGAARRTFMSTPEAVGLALLKFNPSASAAINIPWQDYLAMRGVAFAASGDKALNLVVYTNQKRTLNFRRGDINRELTIKLPSILVAVCFKAGRLQKTQIWCIKPGYENKLTTTASDNTLAAWPYGHVYGHGGVCWGSTRVQDLSQPGEVLDAFFNSGFNGDLYSSHLTGAPETNLPDLVKRVKEDLPAIPVSAYVKSVAAVAQEINR